MIVCRDNVHATDPVRSTVTVTVTGSVASGRLSTARAVGNTTPDRAGCRPFRTRRRRASVRMHQRIVPASMGIPFDSRPTVPRVLRFVRTERRARGCVQPRLIGCVFVAPDAASRATRSLRFRVRTNQNAAIVNWAVQPDTTDPSPGDDDDRRQARVPRPRTGSPRGGRVMRARCSELRRKRARRGSRRDSPSGGIRPVPHVDRIERRSVPRLLKGEPAAERVLRSSCGITVNRCFVNASAISCSGRILILSEVCYSYA